MAEPRPSTVYAQVAHRVGTRVRLRLADEVPHVRLVALADALAGAGIAHVEIRPRTGSVILRPVAADADLSAAFAQAGLKLLDEAPAEDTREPIVMASEKLAQADLMLALISGGKLDLRNVSFLGLMLVGLVQLGRGRIAGPALTVFSQAVSLAIMSSSRREGAP